MAQYEHLPLRRLEGELQRRKRGGFAGAPQRDYQQHGAAIEQKITEVVEAQKTKPRIADIDPSLILKVKLDASISEDDWARAGLTVLATDLDQTLILFADDNELQSFKARVAAYKSGPPEGQKHAQYESFVTAIAELGQIAPSDRIGPLLKDSGITRPDHFLAKETFLLDLELWQPTADMARGASEQEAFDHFRKWEKVEGKPFKIEGSRRCKMEPGSQRREKGSLQCATFRAKTNIEGYGDTYFLAVRCEGGWPLGATLTITNPKNGRSITVRINDRGPWGIAYAKGARLDLARGAARRLGLTASQYVCVETHQGAPLSASDTASAAH